MIYIPKICGPCVGAKNVIDSINFLYERESKKEHQKKIVLYKQILHNDNIIEELNKKGIKYIDNLKEATKEDIVVIRAHGEAKSTFEYLEKNKIEYYDATCPNVLRIHNIIKEKYESGYEIIIIGKKNNDGTLHPEVAGSNGWCDNKAKIISNISDIENLKKIKKNVLIVCQTTYDTKEVEKIVKKIKEKFKNENIEFENTSCNALKLIEKYSSIIAKKSDYMIVIGGKDSSNTFELYKICSEYCKTIKVSNLTEVYEWLKTVDLKQDTNIGITGGASTFFKEIIECKELIEFYIFYSNEKKLVEKELKNYNQKFLDKNDNKNVLSALQKFANINSGGKYLRAMLISLGYKINGKNDDNYLPLAVAYETFQTSILIHDDIIDCADKRRGKDTIPVTYKTEFACKNKEISNKVANSLGICIGDLGLFLASQIIIKSYHDNPNICKLLEFYNDVVIKTFKGEIIDVKLPYDLQYENLKKIKKIF